MPAEREHVAARRQIGQQVIGGRAGGAALRGEQFHHHRRTGMRALPAAGSGGAGGRGTKGFGREIGIRRRHFGGGGVCRGKCGVGMGGKIGGDGGFFIAAIVAHGVDNRVDIVHDVAVIGLVRPIGAVQIARIAGAALGQHPALAGGGVKALHHPLQRAGGAPVGAARGCGRAAARPGQDRARGMG